MLWDLQVWILLARVRYVRGCEMATVRKSELMVTSFEELVGWVET